MQMAIRERCACGARYEASLNADAADVTLLDAANFWRKEHACALHASPRSEYTSPRSEYTIVTEQGPISANDRL